MGKHCYYLISVFLFAVTCNTVYCGNKPCVLFSSQAIESSQALRLLNASDYQSKTFDDYRVLIQPLTSDPYVKPSWDFQADALICQDSQSIVIEVQFHDLEAGVIECSILSDDRFNGQWSNAARYASYTRLNTKRVRSAFFQFNSIKPSLWKESEKPHIKITGLQYLKSILIHDDFSEDDWQRAIQSVPVEVEPMVQLKRPMDIVCSAGVAVLSDSTALKSSIDALHELAPLAKVLGFNAIESYVKWNLIEPELGRFDFSFYDAVVEKLGQYGLKWFPLLIVGSAYSLPEWFINSDENVGFECLEHGISNPIQSIWSPHHKKHVIRVLNAFGKHYEPMKVLQGVRLGPSGNYGESQYPAGGNWGYKGQAMHIHIGYWAGDPYAQLDFQRYVKDQYKNIKQLNVAWDKNFTAFDEVKTVLPMNCYSKRRRLDMARWYTSSMSKWCDWWAQQARNAMPDTNIYQSAGGWGFLEAGTDYVDQTKSMIAIDGGIRLTNETDSFQQNFFATRLAATAARLYGVDLGFEPASSHTARGTVGRLFNTTVTNGDHFFTYHSNIFNHPLAIQKWLEHFSILDTRQDPVIDAAIYYPETMNQLDEGTFRHLYAWGFNPRAREIRKHVEVDYLNETLIRDGFLDRYKVFIFAWGKIIDDDVLEIIDAWMRKGGTVIYPSFPKGDLETVNGKSTTFKKWARGDTGQGAFHRFPGDMEPPGLYGDYVNTVLLSVNQLHPLTQKALRIQHPDKVFFSIQQDGCILAINYGDACVDVSLPDGKTYSLEPYSIIRISQ